MSGNRRRRGEGCSCRWGATTRPSRTHRLHEGTKKRKEDAHAENLEALIAHDKFLTGDYTTRFIDETPELFHFPTRRDRATRLLGFVGDVQVNGNPEMSGRRLPAERHEVPPLPKLPAGDPPPGNRQRLQELGPEGFAKWMLDQDASLRSSAPAAIAAS